MTRKRIEKLDKRTKGRRRERKNKQERGDNNRVGQCCLDKLTLSIEQRRNKCER